MKRPIPLLIILCFVFGCKSSGEKFDISYEKAESYKALARVVETSQRYYCYDKKTQEDANKCVLEFCRSQQLPENTCLISYEGKWSVWGRSLGEYEEQKKIELMQSYVDLCISYGFTEQNAIAQCVQREIHNEKLLSAALQSKEEALAAEKETLDALKKLERQAEENRKEAEWDALINQAILKRKRK